MGTDNIDTGLPPPPDRIVQLDDLDWSFVPRRPRPLEDAASSIGEVRPDPTLGGASNWIDSSTLTGPPPLSPFPSTASSSASQQDQSVLSTSFGVRTNIGAFLEYPEGDLEQPVIDQPPNPDPDPGLYEAGGEQTNIYDRWVQKGVEVKKYVDDVSGMGKLHTGHLYKSKIVDDCETRYIHAVQAQGLFDGVRGVAEQKGMQLNPQKTTLLCMSAARTFKPKTYIEFDGDVILSSPTCRLLGFHFSERPGVSAHVDEILKKVRYPTKFLKKCKE